MSEDPNDPAGWKTIRDGSRVTITRAEADTIMVALEKRQAERAAHLPDVKTAIDAMFDAYDRLRELGWREASYCPKDGTSFEVIEGGSTGIHRARYEGEYPTGTCWIEADGDLWPSRPILFRLFSEDEARRLAKMEEVRERYRVARAADGDRP